MRLLQVTAHVGKLFKKRTRRGFVGARRAQIEFRDIGDEELELLANAIRKLTAALEQLDWVEVNAHTNRVVFAYQENAYGSDDLIAIVEHAERIAQVHNAGFEVQSPHPADLDLGTQRLLELVADGVGFALGFGLSLSPLPPLPFSGNLVAILSLLRGSPRLRRGLEEKFGAERAELLLNLTGSLTQGVAQRPMSSVVDGLHKYALIREIRAQRSVWALREAELCKHSGETVIGLGQRRQRPIPLPHGPIEEYADRAWAVSLSGFALSFLTTRSIQRATAALFGGLPKPARVGRDVFAAELSRELASRGILTMDSTVLRRLDRVDCLVIQGDLLEKERFVPGGLLTEDPEENAAARERVNAMFDSEHPLQSQTDGLWELQPFGNSSATVDIGLQQQAEMRAHQGALLLSLERAGRVVAIVEIEIITHTGVEELIAAAHDAQMRVVIAMFDETILDRFTADDIIPSHEGLRAGVRRLQREGHTVALLGTGNSEGLPLADMGIGLTRRGEPTPWGAHLVCSGDLSDVRFIISASSMARRVSKHAVNIALGAASFGALVSAGGLLPLTTRRVLFVVNSASLISMANGFRASSELTRLALPEPRDPTPWHALHPDGVLQRLGSSASGLSRNDVIRRVPRQRAEPTAWSELGEAISDELFNPLAPLLAAGAGLSAVVGSIADASMVAGVVVLNACVGGVQRVRTEHKIRDLAATETRSARVRRDTQEFIVDASDLVRGDIVLLHPGDIVPADCRLIEAHSLEIDASTLTGESLPVQKKAGASFEAHIADRDSMIYEGTAIASGRALAVVVATGDATEARRGSAAKKRKRAQGGVEQRLRSLMDLTGPIALAAGVGVVGGGLLRGRRMDELVASGVSLAVASVPEGLPLLATAAQLASAERLGERGALVRNGRSIEALGRVDVICLDKTGTVTEGRIELGSVGDGEEREPAASVSRGRRHVLSAALRASPEPGLFPDHDPTDEALFRGAETATIGATFGQPTWQRLSELSFESGRSYHATRGRTDSEDPTETHLLSVKGAPEVVLPMCVSRRVDGELYTLDDDTRYALAAEASRLGRQGLRVLAVAEKRESQAAGALAAEALAGLVFLGFLAFTDPVRPTAKAAIEGLERAGVRTVMITGDHPSTAEAIAFELDLMRDQLVLSGARLADMSDAELDLKISEISVFARVTPSQKVRVVRALQRAGRVVAMVGDGANDAPAIRLADVGIAIGEHSTAAARGAADMVLTDGRVETLVAAVAEGRAMWASVRDAVSILIGGNLGEIGFTALAGLLSGRPPLNARQLLLVNLFTDVAPAMAIALRPPSQATLDNLKNEGPDIALAQPLNREIAVRAGLTAVGAGTAWAIARVTGSSARARTVALAALVGTQLGQTIRSGEGSRTVTATGLASAGLLAAIIQTPGVSHFFGCRPLGPFGWATAISASAAATSLPNLSAWVREWLGERNRSGEGEAHNPQLQSPEPPSSLEPKLLH